MQISFREKLQVMERLIDPKRRKYLAIEIRRELDQKLSLATILGINENSLKALIRGKLPVPSVKTRFANYCDNYTKWAGQFGDLPWHLTPLHRRSHGLENDLVKMPMPKWPIHPVDW